MISADKLLDVSIIRASAAGEKWAQEIVINHYSDEIDMLCTISEEQPDGSTKQHVDEDMRQLLIQTLLEAVSQIAETNDPEKG